MCVTPTLFPVSQHLIYDIYCLEIDNHRLTTVLQENAVLKSELEMLKTKYKGLMEENRRLKQASVNIVRKNYK